MSNWYLLLKKYQLRTQIRLCASIGSNNLDAVTVVNVDWFKLVWEARK